MKKVIFTEKAPAAIGPYSQAVEVNGMVFLSGQIPVDPATGEFVPGGVTEQTIQVFENIKNCLLYTSPSPRDAHESRMPSSA